MTDKLQLPFELNGLSPKMQANFQAMIDFVNDLNDRTITLDQLEAGILFSPNQPRFYATYDPGGTVAYTHTGKLDPVIFETEILDIGSGYNNTTGVFTAPQTGKYFFSAMFPALTGGGSPSTSVELYITTSGGHIQGSREGLASADIHTAHAVGVVPLTAGQTAYVVMSPSGTTATFLQPLRIIYGGVGVGDVQHATFTGVFLG